MWGDNHNSSIVACKTIQSKPLVCGCMSECLVCIDVAASQFGLGKSPHPAATSTATMRAHVHVHRFHCITSILATFISIPSRAVVTTASLRQHVSMGACCAHWQRGSTHTASAVPWPLCSTYLHQSPLESGPQTRLVRVFPPAAHRETVERKGFTQKAGAGTAEVTAATASSRSRPAGPAPASRVQRQRRQRPQPRL